MKIRSNYISNSSSSSFIIAYDPLFFGDIETYFREGDFGCDTYVYDENKFLEENPEYKKIFENVKNEGKRIVYIGLDQEYTSIITLMKMINKNNGGNKMKIIYGNDVDE